MPQLSPLCCVYFYLPNAAQPNNFTEATGFSDAELSPIAVVLEVMVFS